MPNVTISFSLDADEDRDILRWLESLPKRGRSVAIRDALRGHLGAGVTLGDVYQAVRELDRRLARGAVVTGNIAGDISDEPPDVAAALDNLGL